MAGRRERPQTLDAVVEQRRRAVEVASTPVMEADADLQDAVIQPAVRRACVTPQQLERLVLLEELARVELLDAVNERSWRSVGAARPCGLGGIVWRLALRRPRGLARAATRVGRARFR